MARCWCPSAVVDAEVTFDMKSDVDEELELFAVMSTMNLSTSSL